MRLSSSIWFLPFLIFLSISCGTDDDEFVRADGPVSSGDAAETSAEAVCNAYRACRCGEIAGVNLTGCNTGLEFAWQARAEDARENGLTYDGDCLAKRINAMADRGCALPEAGQAPFCGGETCLIFHGDKKEGEECEGTPSSADCEQGLVCLGTCQKPCANTGFDIAEGEVCRDVELEFYGTCADGLLCNPEDGICTALPEAGEACLQGAVCAEGNYCDFMADPQVCAPTAAVGDDCTLPQQCASLTCTDQKCAEAPGEGDPCVNNCQNGLTCAVPGDGSATPTCMRPPGEGETCLRATPGQDCASGLTCSYPDGPTEPGVCVGQPGIGDSCEGAGGIPLSCGEGAICNVRSCRVTPDAPGCNQCADGDDTCTVRVCTEIPPQVCGDSGGLTY